MSQLHDFDFNRDVELTHHLKVDLDDASIEKKYRGSWDGLHISNMWDSSIIETKPPSINTTFLIDMNSHSTWKSIGGYTHHSINILFNKVTCFDAIRIQWQGHDSSASVEVTTIMRNGVDVNVVATSNTLSDVSDRLDKIEFSPTCTTAANITFSGLYTDILAIQSLDVVEASGVIMLYAADAASLASFQIPLSAREQPFTVSSIAASSPRRV